MKPLTQPFDDKRTKIFFPAIICTVLNNKVPDMLAAYKALSKVLDARALSDAIATLADGWYDDYSAPVRPQFPIYRVRYDDHNAGRYLVIAQLARADDLGSYPMNIIADCGNESESHANAERIATSLNNS